MRGRRLAASPPRSSLHGLVRRQVRRCEPCSLLIAHTRMHDIVQDIVESGRARTGLPDDYQAMEEVLKEFPAALAKVHTGCRKAKDWSKIEEAIYDALDEIRFHPVIADHLNRDGVDSVRWYKDSGRILEQLVIRLIFRVRAKTTL